MPPNKLIDHDGFVKLLREALDYAKRTRESGPQYLDLLDYDNQLREQLATAEGEGDGT